MCSELPDIDNGMVEWTGLSPGDIATYTCIDGFILVGVSTRNCGSDGTWSGEEPTCERKLLSPLHVYCCTIINTRRACAARVVSLARPSQEERVW